MTLKNILFVCRGNAVRSIMAEAYMNMAGRGLYRAVSAGPRPLGAIAPETLETLRHAGLRPRNLASTSWEVFAMPAAPKMNLVVSLCDETAEPRGTVWPGHPELQHWSIPDPEDAFGFDGHGRGGWLDAFAEIRRNVDALVLSEPGLEVLLENAARGEVFEHGH